MIGDLKDLYRKDQPPIPDTPESVPPSMNSERAPHSASEPALEIPPGLPQEYVDVNLKNQPVPDLLDQVEAQAQSAEPPKNFYGSGRRTMCNADTIPFRPDGESKIVTDRVEQGPRVMLSAQPQEGGGHEAEKTGAKAPHKVAHPDTSKAGHVVRGEPGYYRPGV